MSNYDPNAWAATLTGDWPVMRVFAFDHRKQLQEMVGFSDAKADEFKTLCLRAAMGVADGRSGYGILCDGQLGPKTLGQATGSGLWIGRPVELPGSRPLAWEPDMGADLAGMADWDKSHVVKALCFCHPDDDDAMWADQIATVCKLFETARRNGLEFLLEVIPSKVAPVTDDTTARIIQRFYDAGVYPDWWKLEPFKTNAAWDAAADAITRNDSNTRGIVVLGLDAPQAELEISLAIAAAQPLVKGFAIGRTIFGDAARAWLRGDMDDDTAIAQMQDRYSALCAIWDKAKGLA